jgi:hypothetical protein
MALLVPPMPPQPCDQTGGSGALRARVHGGSRPRQVAGVAGWQRPPAQGRGQPPGAQLAGRAPTWNSSSTMPRPRVMSCWSSDWSLPASRPLQRPAEGRGGGTRAAWVGCAGQARAPTKQRRCQADAVSWPRDPAGSACCQDHPGPGRQLLCVAQQLGMLADPPPPQTGGAARLRRVLTATHQRGSSGRMCPWGGQRARQCARPAAAQPAMHGQGAGGAGALLPAWLAGRGVLTRALIERPPCMAPNLA